jgi:DNA-directed RNA polymerase alpha subunit
MSSSYDNPTDLYAKYSIGPFKKEDIDPYGVAIRRVLLSEVRGYSCMGVKMTEEFTTVRPYFFVKGRLRKDLMTKVRYTARGEFSLMKNAEDSAEEILENIKSIVIKADQKGNTYTMGKIHITEPGVVNTGDITLENGYSVVDNSQYIATFLGGGSLTISLIFGRNLGYISQEQITKLIPIRKGYLPLPCNFTPVRKVNTFSQNFDSSSAPRGYLQNLVVEISTNGSLTPKEALAFSVEALRRTYDALIKAEVISEREDKRRKKIAAEKRLEEERMWDLKRYSTGDLVLPKRAANCLMNNGISNVYKLVTKYTDKMLLDLPSFGKVSVRDVCQRVLLQFGVDLSKTGKVRAQQLERLFKPYLPEVKEGEEPRNAPSGKGPT